jgi:hypothetical protein
MKAHVCCGVLGLLLLAAAPLTAQITIDADRTITSVDADDLMLGFTLTNAAVLTIAPGTTVNVGGAVLIHNNSRMIAAGTLVEPVRMTFGANVVLDYRPESATGIGMDFQHTLLTYAGNSFDSGHNGANGYRGGAFPAVAFRSSIVEMRSVGLTLRELNYVGESSLFFGGNRLMEVSTSNLQFTDCVFIRRTRPITLNNGANALISMNSNAGEQLFQNCRFSGSIVFNSFGDDTLRFVSCDFSDTVQSIHNGFNIVSVTFENSFVSTVNNNDRQNQNFFFTNCFPDLPSEQLVLNQGTGTSVTITSPLSASPFRSGDVNNDAVVNATDVNVLMDIVVGNTLASSLDFPERADADGNGDVDERDVAVLRAFVDGVLPQLPEVVAP